MDPRDATPVAVAVVEHAGAVLIGPRPEGAPLAGYWEFPGGKVRDRESADEAAQRECLEETGMKIHIERTCAVVEHDYDHGTVRLHFFLARPRDPDQPPRAPFRWVPIAQLDEYRFPAANAAVLRELNSPSG